MIVIPALCFIGGLAMMGRTKPQTNVRKIVALGPRTGIIYPVEDFPEIGVVVVRAPGNRAIAQFLRATVREPGKPGLIYQQGQGDPQLLELIRRDFGVEAAKPAAIASEGAGSKVAGSGAEGRSEPEVRSPKPEVPKSQTPGRSTP